MRSMTAIAGLLGLCLTVQVVLAQDCSSTCDESTGISRWSGLNPVYDYNIRCTGATVTTTVCGGYASSYYVVYGGPSRTAVGVPHAIQHDNGTVYLGFGYHYWGDNLDRIYMGTSTDGGQSFSTRMIIDNSQFCIYGSSGCEFWSPDLVIRDDGTWLLYVTGHQTSATQATPRVFVARSNNGGSSFTFDWTGDNHDGNGVLYQPSLGTQTYRFGPVTSAPGGPFIYYSTGNTDNYLWKFTSNDGISWTRASNLGYWGISFEGARYDNVSGHYIATLDPPVQISDDCSTPTWSYPLIVISSDGTSYSDLSVENYFFGYLGQSAEATPLGDRKGIIQSTTPMFLYMNSQPSSQYNQGGAWNYLFRVDWRRGTTQGYCN